MDVMTLLLDYNNAWSAQGKKFPKTLTEANLRNMVNEYQFRQYISAFIINNYRTAILH